MKSSPKSLMQLGAIRNSLYVTTRKCEHENNKGTNEKELRKINK